MWRVILTFAAAILIIYLSYLVSKYLGKGMNRGQSSRYMRLIDQLTVGQDRHLAVVQVGDSYLLIGITAGQIRVLKELGNEDLLTIGPDRDGNTRKTPEFQELMDKFRKRADKER